MSSGTLTYELVTPVRGQAVVGSRRVYAVLNGFSADIYQVVERIPEIAEALVIGAEQPDGGYWMPLFVVLTEGLEIPL